MSDPKQIKKKLDILDQKQKEIPTDLQMDDFFDRTLERKREIEKRMINEQIEKDEEQEKLFDVYKPVEREFEELNDCEVEELDDFDTIPTANS